MTMKVVQNAGEDHLHLTPPLTVDTKAALPFVSALLPWLYLVHHTDAKQLDRVLAILAKSDGRDKACKITQYMCKLVMAINQPTYKPLVGTLATQLSGTRRVLRLGRCLKFFPNAMAASQEPHGWKRAVATLGAVVGGAGDFGDDVCWASDMNLLSTSVRSCLHCSCGVYVTFFLQVATSLEVWIDRLWVFSVACDLPLNTSDLLDARLAFVAASNADTADNERTKAAVHLHNCRATYVSVWLAQVKLVADFFHSTRRAYDWPTASPMQDALCGLVSASCAMIKMWQPSILQKQHLS
ncbi:hypothetical protein DYB34_004316 [Aphanomyces astaci]|uniref:Uncharacterized protein n=1 Tax=Aphanomyces astaci TaxID=112090 RepID=A0A3R6ZAQ5_APHAT|nr:hypothetical protein DYB34_004316 [Aphanomyces astaci]